VSGIDVTAAPKNRQIELRDWSDTYLRDGGLNPSKTLAFFEEMVKCAKENAIRLVTRWNVLWKPNWTLTTC
jgi:hypothetical protein